MQHRGADDVWKIFKTTKGVPENEMGLIWKNYIERVVVKTLCFDTGTHTGLIYSTTVLMDELWHTHVLCTLRYMVFFIHTLLTNTNCKVIQTNRWGSQALDYPTGYNSTGNDIHSYYRDPEIAIEAIIQESGDVDKPSRSEVIPFEMVLHHSKSELFIPLIKHSVKTNKKPSLDHGDAFKTT